MSAFTASRVYLSEQFPTALRGRGHIYGASVGRIIGHGLVPFFIAPLTGAPTIFFGTIAVFVATGAFLPVVFGKETIGQIELIAAEAVTEEPSAVALTHRYGIAAMHLARCRAHRR